MGLCLAQGYVHTLPNSFCAGTKTIPDRALFTHKNGEFGAISGTRRGCAAPISKVARYILDRFCATLWGSVNSPRTGTHRDGIEYFMREDWNLLHQTLSANRARTVFDVCEQLVPPRVVAVHAIPDGFSCRHEKSSGVKKA